MTKVFEEVAVDAAGNVLTLEHVQKPSLRVTSDDIIPKGLGKGSEAYVIDRSTAAFCDGRDNWHTPDGKSATAGQTWAELY